MRDLTSLDAADAAMQEPTAVLLKHGLHCPISGAAREELADFAARHPEVPVYGVEVTGNRALSEELAKRLGVPHQSPQAFVLRGGRPVWYAEHFDITAQDVERQLES
jgi:bacillithiol system protein YtxJ